MLYYRLMMAVCVMSVSRLQADLCLTDIACQDLCPETNQKVKVTGNADTNVRVRGGDITCSRFCPCSHTACLRVNGICFRACVDVDQGEGRHGDASGNADFSNPVHDSLTNTSCGSVCLKTCVLRNSCNDQFCQNFPEDVQREGGKVGCRGGENCMVEDLSEALKEKSSDISAGSSTYNNTPVPVANAEESEYKTTDIVIHNSTYITTRNNDIATKTTPNTSEIITQIKDNTSQKTTHPAPSTPPTSQNTTPPAPSTSLCPPSCLSCSGSPSRCSKCRPGFVGVACQWRCRRGYYGDGCRKPCPVNCKASTCHLVHGACVSGCVPGFEGERCNNTCADLKFGLMCQYACANTCHNRTCHHVTGACTSGCVAGYQGDRCQRRCASGWGPGCHSSCSPLCVNNTCDAVTGGCTNCVTDGEILICDVKRLQGLRETPTSRKDLEEPDNETAVFMAMGTVAIGVVAWLLVFCLTFYKNKRSYNKLVKRGEMPVSWTKPSMTPGVVNQSQAERRRARLVKELLLRSARKRRSLGLTSQRQGRLSRHRRQRAGVRQRSERETLGVTDPRAVIRGKMKTRFTGIGRGSQHFLPPSGSLKNSILLTREASRQKVPQTSKSAVTSSDIETMTSYPETPSTQATVDSYVERALQKYFGRGFPISKLFLTDETVTETGLTGLSGLTDTGLTRLAIEAGLREFGTDGATTEMDSLTNVGTAGFSMDVGDEFNIDRSKGRAPSSYKHQYIDEKPRFLSEDQERRQSERRRQMWAERFKQRPPQGGRKLQEPYKTKSYSTIDSELDSMLEGDKSTSSFVSQLSDRTRKKPETNVDTIYAKNRQPDNSIIAKSGSTIDFDLESYQVNKDIISKKDVEKISSIKKPEAKIEKIKKPRPKATKQEDPIKTVISSTAELDLESQRVNKDISSEPEVDQSSTSSVSKLPGLTRKKPEPKVEKIMRPRPKGKQKKSVTFDVSSETRPVEARPKVKIVYDLEKADDDLDPRPSLLEKGVAGVTSAWSRLVAGGRGALTRVTSRSPPSQQDTTSSDPDDSSTSDLSSRPAESVFLLSRLDEWNRKYRRGEGGAKARSPPIGVGEVYYEQWPPDYQTNYF